MSKDLPTAERPKASSEQEGGPEGAALPSPAPAGQEDRNGQPPTVLSKAEFEVTNRRRLALVDKEIDGTLTSAEEDELRRLEAEVDAYVRANFPGKSEVLDRLEERARRLGYLP